MKRKLLIGLAAICVCIVAAILIITGLNEYSLELSIPDGELIQVEYGADFELPEVTAIYKGTILNKEGTQAEVKCDGEVNYEKVGKYEIIYTTQYKKLTQTAKMTVEIVDTVEPVIELVTDPDSFTSPIAQYEEEGFTATDNYDGDITSKVERTEKDGVVTYSVTDSSGNTTVVERKIVYKDVVPPTIALNGSADITINIGNGYTEPGFSATDDCDGDITQAVLVSGQVDVNQNGTYTLTYSVADSSGNTCETKRTVRVVTPQPVKTENTEGKVIYLTFDDGPGPYTEKLLDILDTYGIKVTFFVTNTNPKYQDMIGEAYRRGHTIALHTYSHDYSIYSSEATYYEDLEKIRDIVVEQTGIVPAIVRFPGGSSNAVSKKYCQGIMTTLTQSIASHGFLYCDWNVSSGDGNSKIDTDSVINNVINGVSGKQVSIVLQHDSVGASVEAVDDIIRWGLENGYTFRQMTEETTMIHHSLNN